MPVITYPPQTDWFSDMFVPQPTKKKYEFKKRVYTPGWEDIIHIKPERQYTDIEKKQLARDYKIVEGYAFSSIKVAAGLKIPIEEAKRLIEETHDYHYAAGIRKQRYIKMQQSPTPEIVRDIGRIMTKIDDVNDGLVTLGYIGRIAVKRFPAIKPLLNKINNLRDMTDAMMLYQLARLPGKSGKRQMEEILERNKRLGKITPKRFKKIREYAPSFAEFVQIAQTTDNLFGYGLCLGPIVGLVEDATFGLITIRKRVEAEYKEYFEARMQALEPGVLEDDIMMLDPLAQDAIGTMYQMKPGPTWSLLKKLISEALNTWEATIHLSGLDQDLSTDDHLLILAGYNIAVDFLTPLMRVVDPWMIPKGFEKMKFKTGPMEICGRGSYETIEQLFSEHSRVATTSISAWIDEMGQTPEAQFAETLMHDTAIAAMEALDGGPIEWERSREPEAQAAVLLMDYDLLNSIKSDPDSITNALLSAADVIRNYARAKPPYALIEKAVRPFYI